MDWNDLYERLVRYPERPDAAAWAELERRVGAWAALRGTGLHRELQPEVAAETCAEVWRLLHLARGGAGFEGFVQGRFVGVVRRLTGAGAGAEAEPLGVETRPSLPNREARPSPPNREARPSPPNREARPSPPNPLSHKWEKGGMDQSLGTVLNATASAEDGAETGADADVTMESVPDEAEVRAALLAARVTRLQKALDDLRKRNPLHYRAVSLVYLDEASVAEAGDALAVDGWMVRVLLARAREALGQEVDRAERVREARQAGGAASRGKPGRAKAGAGRGGKPGGGKPSPSGGNRGGPGSGPAGGGPGRPGQRKGRPPGGGRPG